MSTAPSEVLLNQEAATDQIVSVFSQIDLIKDDRDAIYAQIAEVEDTKSFDNFKLGGLLGMAQNQKWYKDDGYKNFKGFLAEKFPTIEYRKAKYLIDMYDALLESEVDWAEVKDIGWTKLSRMAPVLDKGNAADWMTKARTCTTIELLEYIKAAKKGEDVPGEDQVDKPVKKNFALMGDQVECVEDAIEKAKEEAETEFDGVALDAICQNYLSGASVAAPVPADQVPGPVASLRDMIQAAGYEEVLNLVEAVWPNITITAEFEVPSLVD